MTGESVNYITREHLEKIADICYPQTEEELRNEQRELLAANGYPDRASLLRARVTEFQAQDFGGVSGQVFYVKVTGESVNYITREHLEKIADIVYPEE